MAQGTNGAWLALGMAGAVAAAGAVMGGRGSMAKRYIAFVGNDSMSASTPNALVAELGRKVYLSEATKSYILSSLESGHIARGSDGMLTWEAHPA